MDGMGGVTGELVMDKHEELLDYMGTYLKLVETETGTRVACSQI